MRALKKFNSPEKIQDFLDSIPINFSDDTCYSPASVLRYRQAHCLEGAIFAAAALWVNGGRPLLLDLITTPADEYHVVALFKKGEHWGAISKTNHAVLRYRDPIYRTVRELAISYFHEYFLNDGRKTLRGYSRPLDLSKFGSDWIKTKENVWFVDEALDRARHYPIKTVRLRRASEIEIKAGKLTEW